MANFIAGSRYIDLFDDDLYDWSIVENKQQFEKHLDTVRLKTLAFLLFEGSVCVPEQWLTSSPVFCRVAAEVVTPWLERYKEGKLAGQRIPPILPAYFDDMARSQEPFVEVLHRRLQPRDDGKSSPIRLSRNLDFEKSPDNAFMEREKLRSAIEEELGKPQRLHPYKGEFANIIHEVLEDKSIDDELERWRIPDSFLKLCEYFQYLHQDKYRRTFNSAAYHANLERLVGEIEHLTTSPNHLDEFDQRRRQQFREFFDRVRADPGNPRLSELTKIRRHAAGLEPLAQRSILYAGRFCMHRALANVLETELQSVSYPLYEAGLPDSFDDVISGNVRRFELNTFEPIHAARDDIPVFQLESADLQITDPKAITRKAQLPWPEIWEAFWVYRLSPKWARHRQRLKREIEKRINILAAVKKTHDPAVLIEMERTLWQDIFGELNAALKWIKFDISPNNDGFVKVASVTAASSGLAAAILDSITGVDAANQFVQVHLPYLTLISPIQLAMFSAVALGAHHPKIAAQAEKGLLRLSTLSNKIDWR